MNINNTYNPMNYNLRDLDWFDLKYDLDDEPVKEIVQIIEYNPKIVAYQMGQERIDFMMNQFTVRLYLVTELPIN